MTMDHIRNFGSRLTKYSISSSRNNIQNKQNDDVVMEGVLAKLENGKNRYFVLRQETNKDLPARLEYYDSEKKFLEGYQPKKQYVLRECFKITRMLDEDKYVIALYIHKDTVCFVAPSESELSNWLQKLQQHKNCGTDLIETPRMEYEHTWRVKVCQKGKAVEAGLTGYHWLCLTNRVLSLVRTDNSRRTNFQLNSVKGCILMDQFISFTLGKNSSIGCGQIHVQADDSIIAQSICNAVERAMYTYDQAPFLSESDLRKRTSSDPNSEVPMMKGRERCDSVPNNPRFHREMRLEPFISPSERASQCHQQEGRGPGGLLEEDVPDHLTPDRESLEFDTGYMPMESPLTEMKIFDNNSPRNVYMSSKSPQDGGYMEMGMSGERNPPNSLKLSPRVGVTYHSAVTSPAAQGMSNTPVSPSVDGFSFLSATHPFVSPQPSTGPHSGNPSLMDDVYVAMQPSSLQSPNAMHDHSERWMGTGYVEMGKTASLNIGPMDRRRTTSTPTPIPLSPSDEDSSYDTFGNSGSSSCTSGTPSDQRIHDLGNDERGATPLGGIWTPGFNGAEDLDCIGCPRPIRTNSVGSKQDPSKRKNRLDAPPPPNAEPSRVRAFSLGSRVSLKFGVGRHGAAGPHQGNDQSAGGLGDMYPSIKECGRQAKSKSTSAPLLGTSPISHSWSGTSGAYFRGFSHSRNSTRDNNLMELDFSKNKSCDVIPSEDKEKDRKTSKDRLWHTFTGHRHRSNSKSSGGSNSRLGYEVLGGAKEKRVSESSDIGPSRGVEIPLINGSDRHDYLEVDFTPSPRSVSVGSDSKGYLPMHPPAFISSSLTNASDFLTDRRGPRTSSLNEAYLEMSSSRSSCASQDGYVDMTQGGGGSSGGLTIASSSSSSTSINAVPSSGRTRRSNLCVASASSQELPSPLEDLVLDEELPAASGHGFATEGRKKGKKGNKRRSLREEVKRKKSEGNSAGSESPEVLAKSKSSTSPFVTFTNFISRKPSTSSGSSSKAPLSPKGSPLPPKSGKESTSPFSSLKRNKNRNKEEKDGSDVHSSPVTPSSPTSLSPQGNNLIDVSPPPPKNRGEEKMLFSPLDASRLRRQSSRVDSERRRSACTSGDGMAEVTSGSLPALHVLQKTPAKVSPPQAPDLRSYVNMQPGVSSPHLSPVHRDTSASLRVSHGSAQPSQLPQISLPSSTKPQSEDSNYLLMGAPPADSKEARAPALPSEVTRRPEIPRKLLSSHSHPPSIPLEKLSLQEDRLPSASSERCRSRSGPGTSDGSRTVKRSEDGRAASACSSPASYSPPTSPTLGSVSSMSSLSEGGLSSASSTCTVVNVGLKNSAAKAEPPQPSHPLHPAASEPPSSKTAQETKDGKSAPDPTASATAAENQTLNYVALDLGIASTSSSGRGTSPRLSPKSGSRNVSTEDTPSSYVEIDFKKSEGLRNTSLERDASRPQ